MGRLVYVKRLFCSSSNDSQSVGIIMLSLIPFFMDTSCNFYSLDNFQLVNIIFFGSFLFLEKISVIIQPPVPSFQAFLHELKDIIVLCL